MKLFIMLVGAAAETTGAAAETTGGPCDIYAAAGTPCVAAHSMVRALYASYDGPLYLVKRADNLASSAIFTKAKGGYANSDAQDTFCEGTNCSVIRFFDQTKHGNHLNLAPAGGAGRKADIGVNASKHKIMIGGHSVYGAYFEGSMGYRCESTWGVATGDEAESLYMVVDGKHYNDKCCFDYGNAEIDALDHGKGTMEAIYWGNSTGWSKGAGGGPWVMADIENGLWAGSNRTQATNTPILADFVTAMLKGKAGAFALKGGDATSATGLQHLYEGDRPPGYKVMRKQGAIILGIGGDNSDWAVGTWYEGVMVSGYATDDTDAAVHANIVAAGYGIGK
jgi:hypothetical protein